MKESRRLLNKAGLPLFFLVIAFSIAEKYVVLPIISGIWKLTLMTTPDGFITDYPDDITEAVRSDLLLKDVFVDGISVDGRDAFNAESEFIEGDY